MRVLSMLGFALVYGVVAGVVDAMLGIKFSESVPLWGQLVHSSVIFLSGGIFVNLFKIYL